MDIEQYQLMIKTPRQHKIVRVDSHVRQLIMRAAYQPDNACWLVHRATQAVCWIHAASMTRH